MKDILIVILILIYCMALITGTVILVEKYNWSGWWFLLTVLFYSIGYKSNDNNTRKSGNNRY